jgi:hypothetical protein
LARPVRPEPGQVALDGGFVLGLALSIGVVEAKDERAAMAPGEQPVEGRRTHVADLQEPVGLGA